jgi:hypothetical protein
VLILDFPNGCRQVSAIHLARRADPTKTIELDSAAPFSNFQAKKLFDR